MLKSMLSISPSPELVNTRFLYVVNTPKFDISSVNMLIVTVAAVDTLNANLMSSVNDPKN